MEKLDTNQAADNYSKNRKEQIINNLVNRFSDKNFCDQYAWAKWSALIVSYLIQVLSILLAFFGVYWITLKVVPYPIVAIIISTIFLIFLAIAQRKTSDALWDGFMKTQKLSLVLFLFCVVFLAISMSSSSFGNWKLAERMMVRSKRLRMMMI